MQERPDVGAPPKGGGSGPEPLAQTHALSAEIQELKHSHVEMAEQVAQILATLQDQPQVTAKLVPQNAADAQPSLVTAAPATAITTTPSKQTYGSINTAGSTDGPNAAPV